MTDETRESIGLKELIEMEGNEKKFQYKGYNCEIKRHSRMGHLCGYVVLTPQDVPLGLQDLPHGGITYEDIENGVLLVGFDCAHAGDLSPYVDTDTDFRVYRHMGFVECELKKMVDYLEKEGIR